MNKYELLEKLEKEYPLTGDNHYYILKNKYIYPSIVLKPNDMENKKDMFPDITNKLVKETIDTDFGDIEICQSNGCGGSTENINLANLLNIEIDTSDYVEVYIKHVFDCVPKYTTSEKTFKCKKENIKGEIENHVMKMKNKFNLHWNEPGILLEKTISEIEA